LYRRAKIGRLAARRHLALAQILAGAEAAARTRDHEHASPFGFNARERIGHLSMHPCRKAVELVGPV